MKTIVLIGGMSWRSSLVYYRVINEGVKEPYVGIVHNLVSNATRGIIPGCAEIGLLVGADDSPAPVFGTTRIHAEAAEAFALQG